MNNLLDKDNIGTPQAINLFAPLTCSPNRLTLPSRSRAIITCVDAVGSIASNGSVEVTKSSQRLWIPVPACDACPKEECEC